MIKNLVIVESPTKAKTISKFLGNDFVVESSFGHIRDLKKESLSIDIENDFKPEYIILPDKKKIVEQLKKKAREAETIWLATDEDREGEAIAWHLIVALGLDQNKVKRIVFHEITKSAILEAIKNPRKINKALVSAQQARRILDRLVGYELSPVLWKKVKPALSAGRVQSVAVKLIVEREKEIKNFKVNSFYKIKGYFIDKNKNEIIAQIEERISSEKEANEILNKLKESEFTISKIETKPLKRKPAPPFTTSTLQQEAAKKLNFSVSQTMTIAQQLYESGKITYMRTDSVHLSNIALNSIAKEIKKNFGSKYVKTRQYTTKSKSAQEAHEAIRPTNISENFIEGTIQQKKLYDLIWKRAVASQMTEAEIQKTTFYINSNKINNNFIATGEVIKFDGFLKVYNDNYENDKENENILPPLNKGDILKYKKIEAIERFTKASPRYNEAMLVKKMEELGIGRPSTYAPIISTIQKRGYVEKKSTEGIERNYNKYILENKKINKIQSTEKFAVEKNKLFPTDIGKLVTEFLEKNFKEIMDYNFTAKVENEFDKIAEGLKKWNKMIQNFYNPFHNTIEKVAKASKKVTGERLLGIDPKTGKEVFVKIARYGAIVQIGNKNKNEELKFAGLRKNQSIDNITLEEALKLFEFPKELGEYNKEKVELNIGKYGPYIKYGKKFISISSDKNLENITLKEAIHLIEEQKEKERKSIIKTFTEDDELKILKGKYGAYIKKDKNNYTIPKEYNPLKLNYDDCLKIIKQHKSKRKK